jgi:hypothetical protein
MGKRFAMPCTLKEEKMKKILLVLLLLLPLASAQEPELKISLIEYNPDTNYARILIENLLPYDLHNVRFQLNTLPTVPLGLTMAQNTATAQILNVPPGLHDVTVVSDEITVEKTLSFSKSIVEVHSGIREKEVDKIRQVQRQNIIKQKTKLTLGEETKFNFKVLGIVIGALIIAIITYIIITKKKE